MPKFSSHRSLHPVRVDNASGELSSTSHTEDEMDAENMSGYVLEPTVTEVLTGKQFFQTDPITPAQPVTPYKIEAIPSSYIHQQTSTNNNNALQLSGIHKVVPQTGIHKAIQQTGIHTAVPQTGIHKAVQLPKTTQKLPAAAPQSLLTALQLTMQPKTGRAPLLIPASMKKTSRQNVAETLTSVTHRTVSRFKMGIVLGGLVAFLFLTAFSFMPGTRGKDVMPMVTNAINWVQAQQLDWNNVASHTAPAPPVAAVVAPAMPAIPQSNLVAIAQQDAIKYGISPYYFVRQINAESGFNPNAYSPAGAVGIAQFIPSTAAGLGVNPYDPISSLDGAARFMANLSNEFGGDYAKALAAYNAGSGAVNSAVSMGGANWLAYMPYETQLYVQKIMG